MSAPKSHITATFRRRFEELPPEIQAQAKVDYRHFQRDPSYPGLNYHTITRRKQTLYAVCIGIHYRALATMEHGELYWFWIGHHSIYDKLIS